MSQKNVVYISDSNVRTKEIVQRNDEYENSKYTKRILNTALKHIHDFAYGVELEAKTILHEIWPDLPANYAGKIFKYLVLTNQLPLTYIDDTGENHAVYKRK